jgi:hypothetical protein
VAYPDHYLASWGGPLGSGEIWQNNLRFISDQVLGPSEQQEMAAEFKTALLAASSSPGLGYSSRAQLDHVKFNRIGPDGKYVSQSQTNQVTFTPVSMSASTSSMPNSVALVVSFTTQFARGPGSKARIYIPAPTISPAATTGRVPAATCLAVAQAWAGFLNDINVQGGLLAGFDLEASAVSSIGDKKGRISGVKVGDVPDTQRRRRNAYVESYSVSGIAVTDT